MAFESAFEQTLLTVWLGVNSPLELEWPHHFRRMVALARARAHALAHDRKKTPNAESPTPNVKSSWETASPFHNGV